ncbi:MAG: hypothetical protein PHT12_06130 [Patescibacteria group bacterium]|nr:hypothetical protein [Patescibacteria group bacterium]
MLWILWALRLSWSRLVLWDIVKHANSWIDPQTGYWYMEVRFCAALEPTVGIDSDALWPGHWPLDGDDAGYATVVIVKTVPGSTGLVAAPYLKLNNHEVVRKPIKQPTPAMLEAHAALANGSLRSGRHPSCSKKICEG